MNNSPFRPRDGTQRKTPAWAWLMACLFCAWLGSPAHAETTPVESGFLKSAVAIDEIVVVAKRRSSAGEDADSVIVDPLKARVLKDIRQQRLLNAEFEWRVAPSLLTIETPRVRWGYDPRDDVRSADTPTLASLPLDVVRAATVFRLDF